MVNLNIIYVVSAEENFYSKDPRCFHSSDPFFFRRCTNPPMFCTLAACRPDLRLRAQRVIDAGGCARFIFCHGASCLSNGLKAEAPYCYAEFTRYISHAEYYGSFPEGRKCIDRYPNGNNIWVPAGSEGAGMPENHTIYDSISRTRHSTWYAEDFPIHDLDKVMRASVLVSNSFKVIPFDEYPVERWNFYNLLVDLGLREVVFGLENPHLTNLIVRGNQNYSESFFNRVLDYLMIPD